MKVQFYIKVSSTQDSAQAGELFRKYFPTAFSQTFALWNALTGYYYLDVTGGIYYLLDLPREVDSTVPVYTVGEFLYRYNLNKILQ